MTIGILAAINRGGRFDNATRVMAVLFNAIPAFWLGLILILIFGSTLGVLPMGNRCGVTLTGGCPPIYQRLNYLLLPTLVLAAAPIASYSRFMRTSMLETISKDYIRTAQAKGLSARAVWFRHGARNASDPAGDAAGTGNRRVVERRGSGRDDLFLARRGAADSPGSHSAGLPDRHDDGDPDGGRNPAGAALDRYSVRLYRSAHSVHVGGGVIHVEPIRYCPRRLTSPTKLPSNGGLPVGASFARIALYRLRRDKLTLLAMAMLITLVVLSILAPVIGRVRLGR